MTDQEQPVRIKRPYNRRVQPEAPAVEAAAEVADPARPRKVRTRKGGGSTDRLHIPPEMIPDGIDLQFVTSEVLGQPATHRRMTFEVNAWEPVTPDMWDSRFDGLFTPKGHKGEINVEGLVLMWRPMELTIEARQEDQRAARLAVAVQERQLTTGQIQGVDPSILDPTHPHSYGRLTKARIPSRPIPTE